MARNVRPAPGPEGLRKLAGGPSHRKSRITNLRPGGAAGLRGIHGINHGPAMRGPCGALRSRGAFPVARATG